MEKWIFRMNPILQTRRIPNHPNPWIMHSRGVFCDDNPSKLDNNPENIPDWYAAIFTTLTIYRHKTENWNPKKKSSGKNDFFTKVLRPEKRKIKYPPKLTKKCVEKPKGRFWGIRFRDKTSGIYKPKVLEFSIHNLDKIEL